MSRPCLFSACIAIAGLAAFGGTAWADETPNQAVTASPQVLVAPQRPIALPGRLPQLPPVKAPMAQAQAQAQARRAEVVRLPETANAAAIQPTTCPDDALSYGYPVVCGYVPVPLDWTHPAAGTIKIYFELYTPARSGPAQSAMLMNWGGPGSSTTANRFYAFYYFGNNLDNHDMLLIDDRGRGLSNTIDCPDLQHGTAPFAQAEAECAAQLGKAASRYGTGDIAQDTDAVRAALGYDKVDYFGWSYGGADVEAYATRFGNHLRSIVLDSPVGTPALFQFDFDQARSQAEPRMIRLDCLRSPTCAPDHPLSDLELDALVLTIRYQPLEGNSFDAGGNPVHVRVDEGALLGYVIDNPSGDFISTGELLAAGDALWRGDPVPLLRLGAEGYFPLVGDNGDPTGFSYGAAQATWSADFQFPWDWSKAVSVRQNQFNAAVGALPWWYFEPFSKQAATGNLLFDFVWPCLWWEIPTPPSPIALPHAKYPHVPTLVLSGDMDRRVPLEITKKVASLYPESVFVQVPEAGHVSISWSKVCAAGIASEFIEKLKADTSCAAMPETVWPAVGRFPLFARDAVPAQIDKTGSNKIGTDERKVVTVAVATVIDGMQRGLISPTNNAVGLRGGTLQQDWSGWPTYLKVNFTNCAFTEDVTVNGTATWSPGTTVFFPGLTGDFSFSADLTVGGAGTKGGTLHVEGKWWAKGPVGNFKVTGTLGGQNVAVLVPEA